MRLLTKFGPQNSFFHHDVHGSFSELLRDALNDKYVFVGMGPVYAEDPGLQYLAPFIRSANETCWKIDDEESLAPDWVLEQVCAARSAEVYGASIDIDIANEWTRAGLILEIARIRGIHVAGRGVIHVPWKLNATITGRFGTEPVRGMIGGSNWTFNPLSLSVDDRWRIRPSDACRNIVVIDFRAMDLCSMISLVPGLAERYGNAYDLHTRTAEILLPNHQITSATRDILKQQLFVHAYGGKAEPAIMNLFNQRIPELASWFNSMPHGEGARKVQSQSAIAFRAALSRALPFFVGEHVIPMFTVHDEIVLDASDVGLDNIKQITKALEEGASQRIGRPYNVKVSTGYTYQEAKDS